MTLVCGVLGLAGCGGDGATDGGDGPSGGTGDTVALWDALAAAFCEMLDGCCAQAGLARPVGEDCIAEYKRQNELADSIADGSIVLESTGFQACIDAFRVHASMCTPSREIFEPCVGVISGTVPPGGPCRNASECVDAPAGHGKVCFKQRVGDVDPDVGVCQHVSFGAAGDPCSWSCGGESDCAVTYYTDAESVTPCAASDGLYCDYRTGCQPLLTEGQACSSSDECGDGLVCSNDTCQRELGEGDTCTIDEQRCGSGLYCSESGRCEQRPLVNDDVCSGDYN